MQLEPIAVLQTRQPERHDNAAQSVDELRNLDQFPTDIPDDKAPKHDSIEDGFLKIVVRRKLERTVVNDMLTLFRNHQVGNFPKDSRSFLGSIRVVQTSIVSPGYYYHFGLSNALNRVFEI